MPKKGGKKNNKKGNKPAAAAAAVVDKVKEEVKDVVAPQHENQTEQPKTEQPVEKTEPETAVEKAPESAPETAKSGLDTQTPAPVATESPAASELKETAKVDQTPVTKEKGSVDEAVEKAQASKSGQLGELEDGDAVGPAVIPEKTTKEPMSGASLPERPKPSESSAPVVASAVASEPVSAESAVASDAAHVKRPYEKPIFNTEENLKPTKIAKTDEEDLVASAAEDKKTIENLAGAGPASTAAYTAPEPVPVKADTEKVSELPKAEEKKVEKTEPSQPVDAPKAEEKKVEKTEPSQPVDTPKAVEKAPANLVSPTSQSGKAASNPDAVAAANAAITSSQKEKAATLVEEPKKPEAALKRGEEPLPKAEAPKETETPKQSEPEKPTAEQPKPEKTENKSDSEATEEKEKKKGGFFGWLKRKFK